MEKAYIKLRGNKTVLFATTNSIFLLPGSHCIVETEHGIDIAKVLKLFPMIEGDTAIIKGNILRSANDNDMAVVKDLNDLEERAYSVCKEKSIEKKLVMKLAKVKCIYDRTKLIFYFVAENRVDFRDLVRDLAAIFKTRIEMRQIGVRDESRILGGFGTCGRKLCCTKFQGEFAPVSIKMAKEQNLNLNSTKISGICGRLLCCLDYEYEVYCELNKNLPEIGTAIRVGEKLCTVEAIDTMNQMIRVYYMDHCINIKREFINFENNSYFVKQDDIEKMSQHYDEKDTNQ